MKIQDITEYGSSGPYAQAAATATAQTTAPTTGMQTAKQPQAPTGPKAIPKVANKVKPIQAMKDLPAPDPKNPNEPVPVYDKNKKLVALAYRKVNKPVVLLDPKTKKPAPNLRGLFIQDQPPVAESVLDRFMALPLSEQLRILEGIAVQRLDQIINEQKS